MKMRSLNEKKRFIYGLLIVLSLAIIIYISCLTTVIKKGHTAAKNDLLNASKKALNTHNVDEIAVSQANLNKVDKYAARTSINQYNNEIKYDQELPYKAGMSIDIFARTNLLTIPTYDGSNQAMHPKVLYFPQKWNGWSYWMSYTPYKKSIDDYENPSIVVSQDGEHWRVPPKLINPVIPAPKDVKAGGHNSDSHLVMNGNTMELWYRYNPGKGNECPNNRINIIYRETSRDGVNWSRPKIVFNSSLGGRRYYFYSPAVIYENGMYKIWFTTGSGAIIYMESKDCVKWSKPASISLSVPGFIPWHLDVIHTSSGYEMVFCAFPKGQFSKNNQSLFYANSVDGVTWQNVKQILKPYVGTNRLDNQQIYRSSLVKVNDMYRLYYSAMNKNHLWHTFLRQGKTIDTLVDVKL